MRFVRFLTPAHETRYGVLEDDVTIREISGDPFTTYSETLLTHSVDDVVFLPPCEPSKLIGIGLNYRDHAAEMQLALPEFPTVFFKAPSALLGHQGTIVLPPDVERVDYEGELAVVIKTACRHVAPEDAASVILGYTCCNDVSARDMQFRDKSPTPAKSFDTFAPLGPCIATEIDARNLAIRTLVNGIERQASSTSMLIFDVPTLIAYLSEIMTLLPGDVISTGTPSGVGPLASGDVVEIELEGVGCLRNTVTAARR
jgi:2-keto-4-pentenoate hydratase/2-oxohepta-3-ene-1,7-dioic acid hydratase in catechol pathway